MKNAAVGLLALLCMALPSRAQVSTDFESRTDGEVLSSQISGLTFTNALVVASGFSLNNLEFPAHAGSNAVTDQNGPITIAFAGGNTASFTGYFTHSVPITITALDASNTTLATLTSPTSLNTAISHASGAVPNEKLTISEVLSPSAREKSAPMERQLFHPQELA